MEPHRSSSPPPPALEQALALLPLEEKLGLVQALRTAPHLVQTESPPDRFLAEAQGDTLSAARRLTRYWNERLKAFGERAFWPLTAPSGSTLLAAAATPSALTESDTAELAHFISFLPPDTDGSPVLYYDKTLTVHRGILSYARGGDTPAQQQQRARLLFAACQKLFQWGGSNSTITASSIGNSGDYVFILRVDPTESVLALRFHKAHIELGSLLARVFPLRLKAWHVVVVLPPEGQDRMTTIAATSSSVPNRQNDPINTTSWITQALPVLLLRWEAILGRPVANIHAGTTEAAVLASLQQCGIQLDRLPPTDDGGIWRSLSTLATASTATAPPSNPTPLPNAEPATATNVAVAPKAALKQASSDPSSLRRISDSVGMTDAAAVAAAATSTTTTTTTTTLPTALASAPMGQQWQQATVQHAEDSGVLDDSEMQRKGLQQLADAVRFLPEHQTAAYRLAQSMCPELVERESHPLKFLRFHRYNAWSAAQRITAYWSRRREIFGDRWNLPMTMTGNGAMNLEDIAYLRMGYFCFLPNDHDGRTVICYDPSRRLDHSKLTRMRIGFYFWNIICENETSIRNGYVGIVLLGNGSFGASSLDGAIRECVDLVMDCFPTKTKNVHLVQVIQPAGTKRSLLQILSPVILSLMGRIMENTGVQHISGSEEEMAKNFEPFGLNQSGLPESAGGSWTYDEFYQWQLERCRLEQKEYDWSRYPQISALTTPASLRSTLPEGMAALPGIALSNGVPSLFPSSDHEFVQIDYLIRRMSIPEKESYVEAMNATPHLVREESKPAWFGQFAGGDFRAAARQLAAYWTLRKQLFGDRALLPMAQTGEGALGRKELTLLSSSFFTVLPTKQNESVIVSYDCAKDDTLDEYVRLRVAFYILSLAMEREMSRTSGIHIIASGMKELARSHEEGAVTNNTPFYSIMAVLPIQVAVVHMIMLLQPDTALYPLDKTVQIMRRLFGSAGSAKGLVHVGTSKEEVIENLAPYGVGKAILPKGLGGDFGYDRFTQWQELRIRFEWGLPAGANDQEALEFYDFSKVIPFTDLPEEEKKERKRRMNVVHSRRKRERERIEIECLQEQCDELRDRQNVLVEESSRLENLLRRAKGMAEAEN